MIVLLLPLSIHYIVFEPIDHLLFILEHTCYLIDPVLSLFIWGNWSIICSWMSFFSSLAPWYHLYVYLRSLHILMACHLGLIANQVQLLRFFVACQCLLLSIYAGFLAPFCALPELLGQYFVADYRAWFAYMVSLSLSLWTWGSHQLGSNLTLRYVHTVDFPLLFPIIWLLYFMDSPPISCVLTMNSLLTIQ